MLRRMTDEQTVSINEAAQQLSRLGATKGGKARASVLTPEQRKDIARQAVRARWIKAGKIPGPEERSATDLPEPPKTEPDLPHSMFRGALKMGSVEMECHVLSDGRRVLTQREVVRVLTAGRDSGNLHSYLQSRVFSVNPLDLGTTIQFASPAPSILRQGTRRRY